MRIRCIHQKVFSLSQGDRELLAGWTSDVEFPVETGLTYSPYGMLFAYGQAFFLVDLGEHSPVQAPRFMPEALFSIIDSTIPRDWRYEKLTLPGGVQAHYCWKHDFVEDPYLYESMIDGDPTAEAVYQRWRQEARILPELDM